ncbi:putative transcription factor FAR family [Dioscorea sansibarensis]
MARRPAGTVPKSDRRASKKPKNHAMVTSQEMMEVSKGNVVAPRLGMVFKSFEEASEFFDRYARHMGFGTKTRRSHKNRRTFELACWKGGKTEQMRHAHCPRPTLISGCPTMIKVRRNIADGLYNLIEVNLEHNHELYPLRLRFVRFKDQLNAGVKISVECGDGTRIRPCSTHDEDELTRPVDETQRLKLERGDVGAIHRFLHRMQGNDSNFFYLMDLDEEGCLKNMFWADGRSRAACHYFGDVVLLDTTFLIGKFGVPLASFVGVNNHGQHVLLGGCILSNETRRTYVWLLRAWLSCMSGHKPNAIITDQCKAIGEAVAKVFPNSHHRQCLGHIMKRIPEKLGGHAAYKEIKRAFKKLVFDSLKVDDFEENWREIIWKYDLQGNEWFKMLYEDRHRWVPAFVKDTFWAGMSVTQRGESLHCFFGHVESKTTLKQFFDEYETTMASKYENEALADFESFHKSPRMFSQLYVEERFCKIFTIGMFEKFQDEVKALIYCHPLLVKTDGPISIFEVKERVRVKEAKTMEQKKFEVVCDAQEMDIRCICSSFQYKGILCRHALSVYNHQDVDDIPSKYILERWRKDFKGVHGLGSSSSDDMVANGLMERHASLHKHCRKLVEAGAVSDDTYEFALNIVNEAMEKLSVDDFKCRGKQFKIVACEATTRCETSDSGTTNASRSNCNINDEGPDLMQGRQKEYQEWRGSSLEVLDYMENIRNRKEQHNPSNWPKPNDYHSGAPVEYQRALANPSQSQWSYQQVNQIHSSNLFYYNRAHMYHPYYNIFLHRSLLEQERAGIQQGNSWGSQRMAQQAQHSGSPSNSKKKKKRHHKEKENREPKATEIEEPIERRG